MNKRQYNRLVGAAVHGIRGLMILIAILLPAVVTVDASILNRLLEKKLASPHTYYLYELLFAEWMLVLLLYLFLNFRDGVIFSMQNVHYLKRVGRLLILKDFIYMPLDFAANDRMTLQFNLMAWVFGYVIIVIADLFAGQEEEGRQAVRRIKLPVAGCFMNCFCILLTMMSTNYLIDRSVNNEGGEVYHHSDSNHVVEPSEHEITLYGDELKEVKRNLSKKEAAAITEVTVTEIYDEDFREGKLTKDTRIPLDLSQLSYFPNLKKLVISPNQEYEWENDEEYNYYYTVDVASLKKLSGLKELSLSYMNIKDLSFVRDVALESLTLEDCNFSEATEGTYAMLSGISSFGLKGESEKLNLKAALEKSEQLSDLNMEGVCVTDANLLRGLKQPGKLEKLTFTVNKKESAFYERLLQPVMNLKELQIAFESEDKEDYMKAYALPALAKLSSLEHLTIKGVEYGNLIDSYDNDLYETIHEADGSRTRKRKDGTAYTFDIEKETYHDYSFLKELKNLKTLTMEHTELTDASFLSELTNLTSLSIANNFVTDLTPVRSLNKLECLDVSCNFIEELEPIAGLVNVKKLSIGNNKISSIEAVRGMTKLEEFDASSGYYYYGDPLYSTERILEEYYKGKSQDGFVWNHVSFGYNPRGMEDLKKSYVYVSEDTDAGFRTFWDDDRIDWDINTVGSYITLKDYEEESIWEANQNKIDDLSPLMAAKNLVFLDISGNKVRDLTPVRELGNLKFLSCMRNEITEIGMVTQENFPHLSYLYLSQNDIVDGTAIRTFERDGQSMQVQYYMTPYFNQRYYHIMEPKNPQFHLEALGFDLSAIIANIGTREGVSHGE